MGNRDPAGSTKPAGTILVVDDDARILELTGKMLRLAGYRVLEANIASEADLIFERNTAEIDLLVSDVQMPSLTGPELAVRLWQRNPRLPVVFMSGCAENSRPSGYIAETVQNGRPLVKGMGCAARRTRHHFRQQCSNNEAASMSCRTMLLALSLIGANPLPGQDTQQKSALAELSGSIRELTDRVSPAVVEVIVNGYGAGDDGGRVSNQISRRQSSGSGVVVDPSGYIITNAHVVQGAIDLKVLTQQPGPSRSGSHKNLRPAPVGARVLGIDRESDLALLKIEVENLPALPFGNSDKLRQGDLVLAIGSPLGLRNSVSMGVVSASGRAISDDNPILYIQTDASINPGNSGGAMVDHDGFLVGVNSFIVTQSGGNEGIGFAIPSNVVRNVYQQLKQKGRVSRGSIRAFVQNVTPVLAKGLGLPIQRGVVVADVEPEGPAERAGLKRKDIILSLNGSEVDTARRFDADINRRQGGEKIELLVQRADERLPVGIVVEEQSAPWDPLADMVSPEKNLIPRLGILCIEIDQRVQQLLPDLRGLYGLIVAAKSPEGQAQFIDLQPGDVIHAINNLPVAWLAVFQKMIDEFHRGDAVVLQIERDGRFQFVPFEIE